MCGQCRHGEKRVRFPDMSEVVNQAQFGVHAIDIFDRIAAGEQVVGGDAVVVFDHVSNLAAPERMGNVVAEKCVLTGNLISPAFGIKSLPAAVIVFRIGLSLADGRVVPEADEQLVDKRSFGRPENVCIDAGGDPVIFYIQDDICAGCHHRRNCNRFVPSTRFACIRTAQYICFTIDMFIYVLFSTIRT